MGSQGSLPVPVPVHTTAPTLVLVGPFSSQGSARQEWDREAPPCVAHMRPPRHRRPAPKCPCGDACTLTPAASPHPFGGPVVLRGPSAAPYLGVLVGVEALWKAPLLARLLRPQAAQHHGHGERRAGGGPGSREMGSERLRPASSPPALHSTSLPRWPSHRILTA